MNADMNVVVFFLAVNMPVVFALCWAAKVGLHWLDRWDGGK